MNKAAQHFRQLLAAWNNDQGPQADEAAAGLAQEVYSAGHPLCVGLFKTELLPRLLGVNYYLLSGHKIWLTQRYRQRGDGIYIFIDKVTV